MYTFVHQGFPGGSESKEAARSAGDPSSILGSGRSAGKDNSNPFQYSCLETSMDKGDWWATYSPWGCKETDATE